MAKRSRRTRRQEASRQPVTPPEPPKEKQPRVDEPAPAPGKIINFSQEYFYVYAELRNVLIITVAMFLVMAGLAYLI